MIAGWQIFLWQGLAVAAAILLCLIYGELRAISKQLAAKIRLDHPELFRDE